MQMISLIGAAFILWGFIATSYNKMNKEGVFYGALNAVGAALIAFTVWEPLNLGVFILEVIWSITGVALVYRACKAK